MNVENSLRVKVHYIDINSILNEFYIRSSEKIIIDTFEIYYNNRYNCGHNISDFINKDYDYSENNYYIYKFKLDDYYIINKFQIFGYTEKELYFEYNKENNIYDINNNINKQNLLIFDSISPFEQNYKKETEIEHIDIYKEKWYDYDRIDINKIEYYKLNKLTKLIIPDEYTNNFIKTGFSISIKKDDMNKEMSYRYVVGHLPVNYIKVL